MSEEVKSEAAEADFDLGELDSARERAESGVEIDIIHPVNGKPLGIKVRVLSFDSEKYRNTDRKLTNDRLRRQKQIMTADDLDAESLTRACALVAGWSGVVLNGQKLDCVSGNIRTVFTKFPFIREQVVGAASNRANFYQG